MDKSALKAMGWSDELVEAMDAMATRLPDAEPSHGAPAVDVPDHLLAAHAVDLSSAPPVAYTELVVR